jgi:cysteine desulfurase
MGVLTEGNVRVSLPADCTDAEVTAFLAAVPAAVARVRERLGPLDGATGGTPGGPTNAPPLRTATATAVVDTLGRLCPIPVIELAKRLPSVPVGGLLAVLADDEAARLDIPAWCEMRAQEYLGEAAPGDYLPAAAAREAAPTGRTAVAYLVRRLS